MEQSDYPALYLDADAGSTQYQNTFLRLVRGEYAALIFAAILAMNFSGGVEYHVINAGLFFVGLILLVVRAHSKPEQWWYRCRALAESVKTLTWRYMMHATPFDKDEAQSRIILRDELHEMFKENIETAKQITNDWSGNDQVTQKMKIVRGMKRAERMAFYLKHRVDEQRSWYNRKSSFNRKSSRRWVWISGTAYVLAASMVLTRIALPDWQYWPIEPLIVIASSVVGWMQIKKFNELAAAYTVTAHEIGLLRPRAEDVNTETKFSEFVNDSEKAFSREHTLWIARQSD